MKLMPLLPFVIIVILAALTVVAMVFCVIRPRFRKLRNFRRLGILALIIIALANPSVIGGQSNRNLSNINVHFVVDNTGSMVAKDVNNNSKRRFEQVRDDINSTISLFAGAKFSVTVLDYEARMIIPLVSDTSTVRAFTDVLSPQDSNASTDSNLSSLVKEVGERVKKSRDKYPERKNIIVFMSDGEDNASAMTSIAGIDKDSIDGGVVFGYGTTNGAKLNVINYNYRTGANEIDENSYITDRNYKVVTSRINEDNLQKIANTLDLKYYNRTDADNAVFDSIKNFADTQILYSKDDSTLNSRTGLYWVFFAAAFILLMWDFSAILGTFLSERKAAK